MKAPFIFIHIGILIFTSCKNPSHPINNIVGVIPFQIEIKKSINNVKSVPLSSIGKELYYIPLETNPECLIRNINGIAISDSLIFVNDGNKLLQFYRNGRFVRQIGTIGRGPGEYVYIKDFCIDNKKRNIYINNLGGQNVLVFDYNGQFKKSFKSPHPLSNQIILNDTNNLMFHIIDSPKNDTAYSWYITDTKGITIAKIKNYIKRLNFDLYVTVSPLYLFNKTVHFMDYGIDTLYFFNNSKKEPYAIFNLGNLKMDPDPLITRDISKKAFERLKQKILIYPKIIENTKYLFFRLNWGFTSSINYCIYDKQTSEVTILKDNGFKNDLDRGIPFYPEYIFNDSILIDYIDANKLLEFIDKTVSGKSEVRGKTKLNNFEVLKQLTDTSNPILIVLK